MRKRFSGLKTVMLALLLILAAAPRARADQVITAYDNTDMQVWTTAPSSYNGYAWYDVIGTVGDKNTDGFETSKMVVTRSNPGGSGMYQDLKIQIYTNFTPGFEYSVQAADIVLNGTYGIAMSNHDGFTAGTLYKNATFLSSQDLWGNGSWYYGSAYAAHPGAALPLPGGNNDAHGATATAYTYLTGTVGQPVAVGTINWDLDTNPSDPNRYLVTVNLPGYNAAQDAGLNTISLFWGTGTCSNDGIQGGGTGNLVPLPPSVLLLGSGLVGLAGLGYRRRSKI